MPPEFLVDRPATLLFNSRTLCLRRDITNDHLSHSTFYPVNFDTNSFFGTYHLETFPYPLNPRETFFFVDIHAYLRLGTAVVVRTSFSFTYGCLRRKLELDSIMSNCASRFMVMATTIPLTTIKRWLFFVPFLLVTVSNPPIMEVYAHGSVVSRLCLSAWMASVRRAVASFRSA